jgi:hypothetical protein
MALEQAERDSYAATYDPPVRSPDRRRAEGKVTLVKQGLPGIASKTVIR